MHNKFSSTTKQKRATKWTARECDARSAVYIRQQMNKFLTSHETLYNYIGEKGKKIENKMNQSKSEIEDDREE